MNIKAILLRALRFTALPRDFLYCKMTIGEWKPSWVFHGCPLLRRRGRSTFEVGENWIACSDPRRNSMGVFQRVTIKTFGSAKLTIGDNVGMSGVSISCFDSITIGNDVLLGSGVMITDSDAHPLHPEDRDDPTKIMTSPVIVGDGVFIGARAIILKGSVIGSGSVIGAGAVVSGTIPAMSIAAGNPARVVRKLERAD